jgi:hypothetical protein
MTVIAANNNTPKILDRPFMPLIPKISQQVKEKIY